jgi:two-component system phosphate regulon response regulator PhoB
VGPNVVVLERNIDVHIRSIRRKLGSRRDLIETVRSIGYRFAEHPA